MNDVLMMPKSSPGRCTILALVAVTYKREQNKNTLQKAPMWSTFMWGGCWGFYSSEVLPPFLVEQVLSLQPKSFPCRASLLLVEQILSLQPKSSGIWNVVGKSGPSFCQGLHTKNGLDLLLAHGHGLVGLAKPYLIFYPLQCTIIQYCTHS